MCAEQISWVPQLLGLRHGVVVVVVVDVEAAYGPCLHMAILGHGYAIHSRPIILIYQGLRPIAAAFASSSMRQNQNADLPGPNR